MISYNIFQNNQQPISLIICKFMIIILKTRIKESLPIFFKKQEKFMEVIFQF